MSSFTKDAPIKTAKDAASNIRDEATDTAYGVKDDLSIAANDAGRRVRRFLDSASDEISQVSDSVVREVNSNPMQSALIALGAGFILGVLFRR